MMKRIAVVDLDDPDKGWPQGDFTRNADRFSELLDTDGTWGRDVEFLRQCVADQLSVKNQFFYPNSANLVTSDLLADQDPRTWPVGPGIYVCRNLYGGWRAL
jgi:hypothetical protein